MGLALMPLVLLSGPAAALTDEEENDAIVYAWDNATFTLYHEVGHMLVDLYRLPVLAREEDAVDNLATLLALDDYNRDGDPILIDAAAGWIAAMSGDNYGQMQAGDFFDEHSVNAQRAYTMICLLVGSDAKEFGEIATNFGLAPERQERCAGDYAQTKASWDAVLAPQRTPNTGEPQITIVYDEPSEATKDGADILRDNEVLEIVAKAIEAAYTLPSAITFRGADCGEDNAFYNSGDASVTLCYELVENYYGQYKKGVEAGNPPNALNSINPQADTAEAPSEETSDEATSDETSEGEDAGN